MNDTYHLVAAVLFGLGWLGIGAHSYGVHRLNRKVTGREQTYLRLGAWGPVVTAAAWLAAAAVELGVKAFPQ